MSQYGIIAKVGPGWVFKTPGALDIASQDFGHLLNDLARQGWKPILAGDFYGDHSGDELILEKVPR